MKLEKNCSSSDKIFRKANVYLNPLDLSTKLETTSKHGNFVSKISNKAKTKTFGG